MLLDDDENFACWTCNHFIFSSFRLCFPRLFPVLLLFFRICYFFRCLLLVVENKIRMWNWALVKLDFEESISIVDWKLCRWCQWCCNSLYFSLSICIAFFFNSFCYLLLLIIVEERARKKKKKYKMRHDTTRQNEYNYEKSI